MGTEKEARLTVCLTSSTARDTCHLGDSSWSVCDTPIGRAKGSDSEGGAAGKVPRQLPGNFGEQWPQPR
jgi:hypothetical protein